MPTTIRSHNGGEPYDPAEIAGALKIGGRTGSFFYLTTASRDYGFTEGTRDSAVISLTPLGRQAVYPTSDSAAADARLKAFLRVDLFRGMLEHYKGSKLPDERFVRNTLETQFGLDPRTHDAFLDIWKKNCRYLGIGAEWPPSEQSAPPPAATRSRTPTAPVLAESATSAVDAAPPVAP